MKVCKKHISVVRRGQTYQIVNEDECVICEVLDKWGW